jgi:hypothetical protein
MCLDQGPSWWQRGWPQPFDLAQDLGLLCPFLMRWTAPATGIAMCQIAGVDVGRRMSVYGYKCAYGGVKNLARCALNSGHSH